MNSYKQNCIFKLFIKTDKKATLKKPCIIYYIMTMTTYYFQFKDFFILPNFYYIKGSAYCK